MLFLTIHMVIGTYSVYSSGQSLWSVTTLATMIIAYGYFLSRTRHYRPAILICLIFPAVPSLYRLMSLPFIDNPLSFIAWIAIPLLVAALVLTRVESHIVALGYLAALIATAIILGLPFQDIIESISFIFMVSVLVIAIATVREKDQHDAEAQLNEREKAEKQIRIQKELVDNVLAKTPNSVLVVNREGSIVLVNDTFYTMFHQEGQDLTGRLVTSIPELADILPALSNVAFNERATFNREYKISLGGRDKTLNANIKRIGDGNILMLLYDVTEDRIRQESLYLTDRLASVGEMAAGVAHELNNPLTSILGLSEIIGQEDLPEHIKEDIDAVAGEAKRATSVVKNMLSFARKHGPSKQLSQINDIIEDVLNMRAYEENINNIRIEKISPIFRRYTSTTFKFNRSFSISSLTPNRP